MPANQKARNHRFRAFCHPGRMPQIDVDAAAADIDHTITAEERFRIAMIKQ